MIDLKETATQQVSEAISEVLKSHSLNIISGMASDLEHLLCGINEASERGGTSYPDIKGTLEILIESIDFAKEDIENS